MTVSLLNIRELLLPGLWEISSDYASIEIQYSSAIVADEAIVEPAILVSELSVPAAVAVGIAAMIIKNPEVTRRFWSGWVQ